MKRLWVAVALAPLMFAAAAHAQTTISTASAPVSTSTTGDLTVTSGGGGVGVSTAGTAGAEKAAVTINSNNSVTNNGSVGYGANVTSLNYVTGILALGGYAGTITNAGTITLGEAANYTDANGDGVVDTNNGVIGQFAAGVQRYGIHIGAPGFTGSILNSGTITVVGDSSAGILIDGVLNGGITSSGAISVTGGNYYAANGTTVPDPTISYGIYANGAIEGNVLISGGVTASGRNAVGIDLNGGVAAVPGGAVGSVEVNSTISASGYRTTTGSTSQAVLAIQANGTPTSLSEFMQGGSALVINGGVAGGISIDATVAATSTVAAIPQGGVYSYGSAPAMSLTGGTIGQYVTTLYGTNTYGLIIGGAVAGVGVYNTNDLGAPVSATGISVSGSTIISDGIGIYGSVSASTVATTTGVGGITGDPTAMHFFGTASTPSLFVGYGGSLSASSTTSTTGGVTPAPNAVALKIDPGASVGAITNQGTILALISGITTYDASGLPTTSGGTAGVTTAIMDKQGSITSITNYNAITAILSPGIAGTTVTGSAIALDLRGGQAGHAVVVDQEQISASNSATFATAVANEATLGTTLTAPTPTITGAILFGAANSTLTVNAGTVTGAISFGSGNNALNIGTGGSSVVNNTTYPLTVTGALISNSPTLAVDVENGVLTTTNSLGVAVGVTADNPSGITPSSAIKVSSLTIGASSAGVGAVIFTANPTTGLYDNFQATGQVTLATGAQIGISLVNKIASGSASYKVISTTGNLTSGVVDASLLGSVPYFYTATISTVTGAGGSVSVDLTRRTAAQAGLNPAESSAYNAIFAAFDQQAGTQTALLSKTTKTSFTHLYDQFLPDYAGGPFETMVVGQQALQRAEAEGPMKLRDDESRGWVQEIGFMNNRATSSEVNGYRAGGFGLAGGYEQAGEDGAVGVAAAFMTDSVQNAVEPAGASLTATALEAGVYWRSTGPGLNASANLNGGWAFFQSHRLLIDQANDSTAATLSQDAKASWNGGVLSGAIALNYPMTVGRLYFRPEVSADYLMVYESAYTETGGGAAMNLAVGSKVNQEATVQGDLVMGANFGDTVRWRPELTLGWRQVVAGGPASTTAHFASGGANFTLAPQFNERGGLLARLGVRAGGAFADFSADAGGVIRNGYDTYDARAVARFLF